MQFAAQPGRQTAQANPLNGRHNLWLIVSPTDCGGLTALHATLLMWGFTLCKTQCGTDL